MFVEVLHALQLQLHVVEEDAAAESNEARREEHVSG